MRSMKLLAIMLAVSIVLSLTASAHADFIGIAPSSGPIGTHVVVTVPVPSFDLQDSGCTISSSPNGLISNPRCVLSLVIQEGQTASASFTVACASAGEYEVIVTGNPVGDQDHVLFINEGG
jgi:hypothetical protein